MVFLGGGQRLTFADLWVVDGKSWIAVETWLALLALAASRVVEAVVADATADTSRQLVHGRVEVAGARVAVAIALYDTNAEMFVSQTNTHNELCSSGKCS